MENCAICHLPSASCISIPPRKSGTRFSALSSGFCGITRTQHPYQVGFSWIHEGTVPAPWIEASDWGCAVRDASDLVKKISGCERVYAIAFGEGAQHIHLHRIPRHLNEPASKAWAVADLYQDMDRGDRAAADPAVVAAMVQRCRSLISDPG